MTGRNQFGSTKTNQRDPSRSPPATRAVAAGTCCPSPMMASGSGDVKCQMPAVTEQSNRIRRGSRLSSSFSCGLASVVPSFLVGLVSGAAAGLLLGATAVVVLRSLELLDGNKLLVQKLQSFLTVKGRRVGAAAQNVSHRTCNDHELNCGVSVLAEAFGLVSAMLSLSVGIGAALPVYSVMTKSCRAAAVVAATVCLTCVAASGAVLGLTMETFLFFIFNLDFSTWLSSSFYFIGLSFIGLLISYLMYHYFELPSSYLVPFTVMILAPGAVYTIVLVALFFKTKLVLIIGLIPVVCGLYRLERTHDFHLTTAPVLLMLSVTEAFNIANQPIAATTSDVNGAVHEGVFVGLLTSQMFTAAVGMSVFASGRRDQAGKVCVGAAACGAAALAAAALAAPLLGPGPTIGALTGAAGAVGVCLSAAGAAAGQPCGWGPRLGATLGAAAGAAVASCSHSGLSATFMALCAAGIPAGLHLQLMVGSIHKRCVWPKLKLFPWLILLAVVLTWSNFACIDLPDAFGLFPLALIPFLQWVVLLMVTLNMDK